MGTADQGVHKDFLEAACSYMFMIQRRNHLLVNHHFMEVVGLSSVPSKGPANHQPSPAATDHPQVARLVPP